jgi:hypothetical protein
MKFLTVLLVVQVALAVVLKLSEIKYQPVEPTAPLLACDFSKITKVVIEEAQGEGKPKLKVVLEKTPQGWQIPDLYAVPAATDNINQLFSTLKELKKGFPITTTSGAAEHFKVSSDNFERSISLSDNSKKVSTLYFGSSPAFKSVYAKSPVSNEIYTVDLTPYQIDGKQNDWVDHTVVDLKTDNIKSVDMGSFKLQKNDGKWMLTGQGKESKSGVLHDTVAQNLLDAVAHVSISNVLGIKPDPAYNMDSPVLSCKVSLNKGDEQTYTFSKAKDKPYYVLKVSSKPWYFSVDDWSFNRLKSTTADSLLKAEAVEAMTAALAKKAESAKSAGEAKKVDAAKDSPEAKKVEAPKSTGAEKK